MSELTTSTIIEKPNVALGAQIHAAAALAAERSPGVARRKHRWPLAGGAGHAAGLGRIGRSHAHKASSNGMSTGAGRRRPSASVRISRTCTIRRWPVISGTRPSLASMRRRSSW